ncbi:MAG TPA: TIGR03087 family PEP-CTERM/XrtA system glycosyltransferase [Rhizomicrobium sp.]|nr:TIGR03087 family PEP-CTERM/XrtA system glycosyltransferase [Rhizomicrobium sp.]
MRDLLFLAHRIPYPPNKGDKIRSFHILRHLSSSFKIYLGCFVDDPSEQRYMAPLREFCAEVFCVPLPPARKAIRALRAIALGQSFSEAIYQDAHLRAWVANVAVSCNIRDVFVFCSAMSPYVQDSESETRVVTDMVDVDSEKWGTYASFAVWPVRLLYRLEQRRVHSLEKRAVAACERALFVSKAEADLFLELMPEAAGLVGFLENGVDLDVFDPALVFASPFSVGSSPIVFTGAMNYRPNVDAVQWFAGEVFPAIRQACGRAEFWIAGANPVAGVRRLAKEPGVRVAGAVADVRPYLANAHCVVAPMRMARGVQNKVLEAMAMARPVILTPAALEGLSAIPGREVLMASNPSEFADRVSEALSGLCSEIGFAARKRVERDHSWQQNLKVLDALFEEPACRAIAEHAVKRGELRPTGVVP